VKREQARWRKAAARQLTGRTPKPPEAGRESARNRQQADSYSRSLEDRYASTLKVCTKLFNIRHKQRLP